MAVGTTSESTRQRARQLQASALSPSQLNVVTKFIVNFLGDELDMVSHGDVLVYLDNDHIQVDVHGPCSDTLEPIRLVVADLVDLLTTELEGLQFTQVVEPSCGTKVLVAPSPPPPSTPPSPPPQPPLLPPSPPPPTQPPVPSSPSPEIPSLTAAPSPPLEGASALTSVDTGGASIIIIVAAIAAMVILAILGWIYSFKTFRMPTVNYQNWDIPGYPKAKAALPVNALKGVQSKLVQRSFEPISPSASAGSSSASTNDEEQQAYLAQARYVPEYRMNAPDGSTPSSASVGLDPLEGDMQPLSIAQTRVPPQKLYGPFGSISAQDDSFAASLMAPPRMRGPPTAGQSHLLTNEAGASNGDARVITSVSDGLRAAIQDAMSAPGAEMIVPGLPSSQNPPVSPARPPYTLPPPAPLPFPASGDIVPSNIPTDGNAATATRAAKTLERIRKLKVSKSTEAPPVSKSRSSSRSNSWARRMRAFTTSPSEHESYIDEAELERRQKEEKEDQRVAEEMRKVEEEDERREFQMEKEIEQQLFAAANIYPMSSHSRDRRKEMLMGVKVLMGVVEETDQEPSFSAQNSSGSASAPAGEASSASSASAPYDIDDDENSV